LAEVGYDGLTIEAVASRAGVGRPTVYRRWANKGELAMAAATDVTDPEASGRPEGIEVPNTGTLVGDLGAIVRHLRRSFERAGDHGVSAGFLAEVVRSPELALRFQREWLAPVEAHLSVVFDRAADRKEVGLEVPGARLLEAAAGIVAYRQGVLHQQLSDAECDEIAAWIAAAARVEVVDRGEVPPVSTADPTASDDAPAP
jgi:AcrR family transcriptional regulator